MKDISAYYVYILKCSDGTYYSGITTNIVRRINEHNHSKKGAKYTLGRRPVELVYLEEAENESIAKSREFKIKKLSRADKAGLINTYSLLSKQSDHSF